MGNEKATFTLVCIIKFNVNFVEDLKNPESSEYIRIAKQYRDKLKNVYKIVHNFKDIIIRGFWQGSVFVDYDVILSIHTLLNASILLEDLNEVEEDLRNLTDVDEDHLNETYGLLKQRAFQTAERIISNKCLADNPCEDGYKCNSTLKECVYKCVDYDCPKHAMCDIDENYNPQCRCQEDDNYVYSGPDCSIRSEKLLLSSTAIIIISVSVGVAIILIVVIIFVCITYRRMKRRKVNLASIESESGYSKETLASGLAGPSQRTSRPAVVSVVKPGYYNDLMGGNSKPQVTSSTAIQSPESPQTHALGGAAASAAPREPWLAMNPGQVLPLKYRSMSPWTPGSPGWRNDDESSPQRRSRRPRDHPRLYQESNAPQTRDVRTNENNGSSVMGSTSSHDDSDEAAFSMDFNVWTDLMVRQKPLELPRVGFPNSNLQ